jgi:hypothetical protein
MLKLVMAVLLVVLLSGCAGSGFNKKCTVMPDEFWIQNEVGPNAKETWKEIKVVGGAKWKMQ